MRVVCVWREGYNYSRTVEEWLVGFERITGKEVESIDPGTRVGEEFCRAYDIVEYPTMLALTNDGAVVAMWRGAMLPTFDEVSYWA